MLVSLARAAFLAIVLTGNAGGALADDLADFIAAAEQVESHNRVAIGYLHSGNVDLAAIELDRLRAAWGAMQKRFTGKRPDAFAGNAGYALLLTDVSMRLVTADMMLNSGRPEIARQALDAVRADFYDVRRSAGIQVLADCIRDANTAMDALMVYNKPGLDWSTPDTASGIVAKVAAYGSVLDRCDAMADADVRQNPEFRRLVDGAKASMKFIPQAIAEHDTNLLHRILIEVRSFDNLLAFRYG